MAHEESAGRTQGDPPSAAPAAQAAPARVLYAAEATVMGGREQGHGRTNDGALDAQLRVPKEMGETGDGTIPNSFAVGSSSRLSST